MKYRFIAFLFWILATLGVSTPATAQEMATGMRSNGKIYVVVVVLATIFAGIFAFLIYLERKVKKLESED